MARSNSAGQIRQWDPAVHTPPARPALLRACQQTADPRHLFQGRAQGQTVPGIKALVAYLAAAGVPHRIRPAIPRRASWSAHAAAANSSTASKRRRIFAAIAPAAARSSCAAGVRPWPWRSCPAATAGVPFFVRLRRLSVSSRLRRVLRSSSMAASALINPQLGDMRPRRSSEYRSR